MRVMSTVSSRNPQWFDEGDYTKMVGPKPLPIAPRRIVKEWVDEQRFYYKETSRPMPDYVVEIENNVDKYHD